MCLGKSWARKKCKFAGREFILPNVQMNNHPFVTVIIPAYNSFLTIENSLKSFCKQIYPAYKIIVVDSSPDCRVEDIVRKKFPEITFIHSAKRLLPHAARNLGVQKTFSELLVFTDPDVYAPADWLENMVNARRKFGGVIIGSLTNHTGLWLDWGIHLLKFDFFLPGDEVRPLAFGPTANMLCSRKDFEQMGGFESTEMLGDLLLSWKFTENHIPIFFVPQVLVAHHHAQSYFSFLHECYIRGMDFGRLRHKHFRWTRLRTIRHILLTMSGLRLIGLLLREGRHSLEAKLFIKFLYTFPVSFLGQIFWLLGETTAFIRALTK
jgi:GT2 family glycosyltransferase